MTVVQARLYHFETMKTARLLVGCAVFFALLAAVLVPLLIGRGFYGVMSSLALGVLAIGGMAVAADRLDEVGLVFELRTRRLLRRVAVERNLSRPIGKDKGYEHPTFGRFIGNREAFRLVIRPLVGQTAADWDKAAAAFSLAFESKPVQFSLMGNGLIAMEVGTRAITSSPVERCAELVADDSVLTWRQQLSGVYVGTNQHSESYLLHLIDRHVLIAGVTGAGKGSWIWAPLLQLAPLAKAGVVKLWGIDPKRMELSMGQEIFGDRYASKPEAIVELLEKAHDEMQERADKLAGKTRKFEPSPETPLNVIVIDELGYTVSMLRDRKLQARIETAISGLLVLGRAVGYSVIGALQDPRKQTLDFRDLFPTRVALKLDKPMVDLVLGTGAHEAGAYCDQIPLGEDGAGVAYVLTEGSLPQRIRALWCSDESIRAVAESFGGPEPLTA